MGPGTSLLPAAAAVHLLGLHSPTPAPTCVSVVFPLSEKPVLLKASRSHAEVQLCAALCVWFVSHVVSCTRKAKHPFFRLRGQLSRFLPLASSPPGGAPGGPAGWAGRAQTLFHFPSRFRFLPYFFWFGPQIFSLKHLLQME